MYLIKNIFLTSLNFWFIISSAKSISRLLFTKTSISDNSIPNRHEVAHQTRNSPYKKYDCIKLYIFLAEILELFIVEDKLSH